jgi:molybdate transport system substrate-binding protein
MQMGLNRRAAMLGLITSAPLIAAASAPAPPLVFAAASLRESLTEAADLFAKTGGVKPVLSFAGSSTLARQIEQGAPADLFISADEEWMDYLAQRRLIVPASRRAFLGNRLVLIAPAPEPITIPIRKGLTLDRVLGDRRLVMADPNSVPAGRYGKAALTSLGAWDGVEKRVVSAEDVRGAMAFVERGEARLGVVYATDAKVSRKVMVAGVFPETSHPPISYPLALVAGRSNLAAARFRDFLHSRTGKAVFVRRGFTAK